MARSPDRIGAAIGAYPRVYSDEDEQTSRGDSSRYQAYMMELVNVVSKQPGIEDAAAANAHPLSSGTFLVEVRDADTNEQDSVSMRWVMPRYFATIRQTVMAGREFTNEDRAGSRPVAVVNRAFQQRFGRAQMVGTTIGVFGLPRAVVGVVNDSLEAGPVQAPAPQVYIPANQFAPATTLLVRSTLPAG